MSDDGVERTPPITMEPMRPDVVRVARVARKDDLWPNSGPLPYFAAAGLVILLIGVALAVLRRAGVPVAAVGPSEVAVAVMGLGVGVWAIVRAVRRARAKKAAGPEDQSDPDARLQTIGDRNQTEELLREVSNVSFEPVVMRCVYALSHGQRTPDGKVAVRRGLKRGRVKTTHMVPARSRVALGVCAAVGVLGLAGFHALFMDGKFTMNYFEVIAAMVVGAGVAAFVCPTYVRLAPGVLDVFHFGLLGIGQPEVARYDLRRARVHVHVPNHFVRIEFPEHPEQMMLYVDLRRLLGGSSPKGRAFLLAAMSTHPTPPMPDDRLE
ncbi:MAG: hypothetical protein DYG92_03780 [Leptolyngbya sp. PLA1]|nr:hypothetical protein [Leptolyngbya sp. PLA1]